MTETRDFHLGDILTITTEFMVTPNGVDGIYQILNWMTGDNLFTHQLPRATRECAPDLLRQHPDLAAVTVPAFGDDEREVWAWLDEQVRRYGETRPVAPLHPDGHTRIDPLTELRMIAPHVPVIGVEIPPTTEETNHA
ncbi:DUF7736 domain-containing protein [Sphaerimonospora thailandensis]|uniref:DUF7736 domain-containing protein n=1 Tax=Sphaerimonospora thailandensis TaxID=795644 RepID=A0A8J3R8H6_9ACTN|nr:hypothetical protein [Sphaerimonospora thailandensis]GIH70315.1 hypothetical protein Mth01_25680 [Sphaerimonospora thailandensis]